MNLVEFVRESNRIEGIRRDPTSTEVRALRTLLDLPEVAVDDLVRYVAAIGGGEPRFRVGLDVVVGEHVPPRGGGEIHVLLAKLLAAVAGDDLTPYQAHVRYETLHPFMDGNGRSGRALWAWQMRRDGRDPFALPFLHRFYYQALDGARP